MKYNEYHSIENVIASKRKILLTAHANPDGDTIGSSLALYHYLKQFGHEIKLVFPNEAPLFLAWLPAYPLALIYDLNPNAVAQAIDEAEIIFAVDYNAFHRTGDELGLLLQSATALKIMIDHHPNPADFDFRISDTSASSTAELVYRLISDLGQLAKINKDVAACLYVGLITDTGSFSYSVNSAIPFQMAAFLYQTAIDLQAINQKIYSAFTESRLRLTGFAVSEKLTLIPDLRLAYIALTKNDLARFKHQNGDTEGLVNYALSLENVVIAVLLTEKEDKIRLSFRSKSDFAVNTIANKFFDGGGHKNAAGGNSYDSMEDKILKLNTVLQQYKSELEAVVL